MNVSACFLSLALISQAGPGQDNAQNSDQITSTGANSKGAVTQDVMLGHGVKPRIYNYWGLLKNPKVIKEIDLTEEQQNKLTKVKVKIDEEKKKLVAVQAKYHQQFEEAETEEERAGKPAFTTEELNRRLREVEERLMKTIFDRKQQRRLKELMYQAEGPRFFERDEAKEGLALSAEQSENLKDVSKLASAIFSNKVRIPTRPETGKVVDTQSEATKIYIKSIDQARQDAAHAKDEVNKLIMNCLTASQRAKYTAMIGKRFDFTSTAPPTSWLK